MASEPTWLTIDELCEHLRITRDTAYAYAKKGMPSHKIGQRYRFDRAEVDKWVKQGGAAAPAPKKRGMEDEGGEV